MRVRSRCLRRYRWPVLAIGLTLTPPTIGTAQSPATRVTDSVPALAEETLKRLYFARQALAKVKKAHPDAQLPAVRLPLDPHALERGLTADPRLAAAVKEAGLSPREYARDFARIVTTEFAIILTRNANNTFGFFEVNATNKKYRQVADADQYFWLRFRLRDSSTTGPAQWSDWQFLPKKDVAFVLRHEEAIDHIELTPSRLRLSDQLPAAQVVAFPAAAGGDYLDSTDAPTGGTTKPPLRVLFIGDGGSMGHEGAGYRHNEMYRLFRLIAAAGLDRGVVVGEVTRGTMSFPRVFETTPAAGLVLRDLPWDYVVVDDWKFEIDKPTAFADAVRQIDPLVRAASARLVISTTYEAFRTAVRNLNAIVTPTGTGAHLPSDLMYKGALVYYRTITGRSTRGLPAPPVRVNPYTTEVLSPQVVEQLQRAVDALPPAQ